MEEFFGYKETIKLGEVHGFIKGHEGLLQSIDVSPENSDIEENAETNSATVSKNDLVPQKTDELTREDLKKCVKNFMQLIQQQEATKKEFTSAIDRLIAEKEKQQAQTALNQTGIEYSGSVKNTDAEVASLWKRIIKSEKENAVLKTQLEAEKREATLKHEAAMEMKRVEMEHLKKQMDIYISSLEELRKENETLLQENEELKHKTQSIRYEQIQSRLGILHNQKKENQ